MRTTLVVELHRRRARRLLANELDHAKVDRLADTVDDGRVDHIRVAGVGVPLHVEDVQVAGRVDFEEVRAVDVELLGATR